MSYNLFVTVPTEDVDDKVLRRSICSLKDSLISEGSWAEATFYSAGPEGYKSADNNPFLHLPYDELEDGVENVLAVVPYVLRSTSNSRFTFSHFQDSAATEISLEQFVSSILATVSIRDSFYFVFFTKSPVSSDVNENRLKLAIQRFVSDNGGPSVYVSVIPLNSIRLAASTSKVHKMAHAMIDFSEIVAASHGELDSFKEQFLVATHIFNNASIYSNTNNVLKPVYAKVMIYGDIAVDDGSFEDNDVERYDIEDTLVARFQFLLKALKNLGRSGHKGTVYFGTNRKPNDSLNISKGFGNFRDELIHFGKCIIEIPKSHRIGSTKPPLFRRLIFNEYLKLVSTIEFQPHEFWENLHKFYEAHNVEEHTATIFIHGYNVSFEEAAIQTAQIACDLALPGVFAFYSWPSKGELIDYPADEASVEASEEFIAAFIIDFIQKSGALRVNVIAHSMGNRGLIRGFERIIKDVFEQTGQKLHQIILAAPDVDKDVFKQLSWVYPKYADRTTLYVSNRDQALRLSGYLHKFPRAGISPPIIVCTGIDTVHVGKIDLSLLGHGYVSSNRIILSDIHSLLSNNTPPSRRMGLSSIKRDKAEYWYFRQ